MCGRYFLDESPELRPYVERMNRSPLIARFEGSEKASCGREVRPSMTVPAVATDRRGRRAVFPMKWGFSGRSLLINARSETAAVKPMFREAWEKHRCVLPAARYFEWERLSAGGKAAAGRKYALRPRGEGVVWLCGLYRIEDGIPCCVILTRESAEGIRFIHDRMPLILPERLADEWIRPDASPESVAGAALDDMVWEPAS